MSKRDKKSEARRAYMLKQAQRQFELLEAGEKLFPYAVALDDWVDDEIWAPLEILGLDAAALDPSEQSNPAAMEERVLFAKETLHILSGQKYLGDLEQGKLIADDPRKVALVEDNVRAHARAVKRDMSVLDDIGLADAAEVEERLKKGVAVTHAFNGYRLLFILEEDRSPEKSTDDIEKVVRHVQGHFKRAADSGVLIPESAEKRVARVLEKANLPAARP